MHVRRTIHRRPQRGFTLVELLVVILIIAILMAILIPIGAQMLGISRNAATKTTIKKTHELLQKKLDAFNRAYGRDFKRRTGYDWEPANPQHVLDRKVRFKQLFSVPLGTANVVSDADSSEILYKLLTEVEGFGTAATEAREFGTLEIGDTDNDGNMEFLDAWGRPLRFYLYPTRLFKTNGHQTTTPFGINRGQGATILYGALLPGTRPGCTGSDCDELNRDQDDQFGMLFTFVDSNNDGSLSSSELSQFENVYHTYSTYHTPLIVSAGPDGEFGLFSPTDSTTPLGRLAQPQGNTDLMEDNITNYNTRTGAD